MDLIRIQSEILSNIQDMVIVISREMKTVYANRATVEQFGSSPEMFTEPCFRFFKGQPQTCENCPVIEVFKDGQPHQSILNRVDQSGEEVWKFIRAFPFYDTQGELVGAIQIISDYTDLKRAQDAAAERSENLESVFDSVSDFLFVLDDEGRIVHVNPVVEKRLGYAMGDLIGRPVTDVHPPERREEAVRILSEVLDGRVELCSIPLIARDSECIPVETKVVQARWSGRNALIGIARDITERLKGEQERLNLERQLFQIQKSESLGLMAGAIAHHFNNLLGAVMGNIELAQDDVAGLPHALQVLENAMAAARRAAELSRLMLSYLGKSVADRSILDVTAVWTGALSMLQASKPPKVRLLGDFPTHGTRVMADSGQMRQLLTILVTNGWEAFGDKEGDVAVSTKIVHGGEIERRRLFPVGWRAAERDYLCLEVSDTGCGIDPEALTRVFDPFFTTKFVGRGMGLAVAAGILKAHEGALAVDSEAGRGSIFRAYLPVVPK